MNNNGGGSLATREEHGLAAMALAAHLDGRERAGEPMPPLFTLAERAERRQCDVRGV
jgi:hypothetical protein